MPASENERCPDAAGSEYRRAVIEDVQEWGEIPAGTVIDKGAQLSRVDKGGSRSAASGKGSGKKAAKAAKTAKSDQEPEPALGEEVDQL